MNRRARRTRPHKTTIMQRFRARPGALINKPPKHPDKYIRAIGCSYADFKFHFERLFEEGMTWANHSSWELHHIIPCLMFDENSVLGALEANHWSNLRPIWYEDKLGLIARQKKEQIPNYNVLKNLSPRDTILNCNKIPIPKNPEAGHAGQPKFQNLTPNQRRSRKKIGGTAKFRKGVRLYKKDEV